MVRDGINSHNESEMLEDKRKNRKESKAMKIIPSRLGLILVLSIILALAPIFSVYAGITFHAKDTLIGMFKTLCDAHSAQASYAVIGKSYENRDIYVFRFGNPSGGAVMWDGSLHGWEDIGSEIEYLMAQWLLTSNTAEANRILQNNYVLFIPIVNMDSLERGNRDFSNNATYGVDLNRNFVTGFTYISPPGTDQLPYHGASGASEPETRALRSAFQSYQPKVYVNTHYGGGPYLQSCGSNATLTNWIKTRIAQISTASGFTFPWSLSSGGGGSGMAVGDANSCGANSWLWEIAADGGTPYHTGTGTDTYMHNCQTLTDVQTWYFPKMLPALMAMCESVEVISPTPPPTNGSSSYTIQSYGTIVMSSQKLQTSGTNIIDWDGNPKTLVSVNMDHNEYNKGYFTADDVARMQAHGGNCLELNGFRVGYMMPSRGSIDSSYLAKLDGYVNICENAGMYMIFTFDDMSYTTWGSGMPNWMLDGHGYGTAPYSEATVNQALLDFFDTDNPLHNDNRQSFIDLWVSLATRYKDKQYVMFGIMNEPFSHCPITSRTQSQHMGVAYARYMERVVDAIHAVADNLIFIDFPYVWYLADVQPVNREGIVWEDHLYVNADTPADIASWKSGIDAMAARFAGDFGKPFYLGEYGPFPTNMAGWLNVFTQLAAYLQGRVAGRAWHEWGALAGEFYNEFSVADSETLLSTVYPV